MPSNHLILCRPLLLLPSVFPNIRVFSNESALRIRWPKYWSFSFSISPSTEYSGLISLGLTGWISLQSKGLSRVFSGSRREKLKWSPRESLKKRENDRIEVKVNTAISVELYYPMNSQCESWTMKKTDHRRIDAFELWCWRRLLRVPWTARRSNKSIHAKGDQSWVFIGRTYVKAETPILWPSDAKS